MRRRSGFIPRSSALCMPTVIRFTSYQTILCVNVNRNHPDRIPRIYCISYRPCALPNPIHSTPCAQTQCQKMTIVHSGRFLSGRQLILAKDDGRFAPLWGRKLIHLQGLKVWGCLCFAPRLQTIRGLGKVFVEPIRHKNARSDISFHCCKRNHAL